MTKNAGLATLLGIILSTLLFVHLQAIYANKMVVQNSVVFINNSFQEAASGPYSKYRFSKSGIGYTRISAEQKAQIAIATRSLISTKYYEFGETLYSTELSFNNRGISLEFIPLYHEKLSSKLDLERRDNEGEKDYVDRVKEYVEVNFQYARIGNEYISLNEFLETRNGQRYNFSEFFYLIGKENGLEITHEFNDQHIWNKVKINDEWVEVDLTLLLMSSFEDMNVDENSNIEEGRNDEN